MTTTEIKILKEDTRAFKEKWPGVGAFLEDAKKRSELWGLLCYRKENEAYGPISSYGQSEIQMYLSYSACREPWFLQKLHDAGLLNRQEKKDMKEWIKSGGLWIVQLEAGVWLDGTEGDPGRTMIKENAWHFSSFTIAQDALKSARTYRPFEGAKIVKVDVPNQK